MTLQASGQLFIHSNRRPASSFLSRLGTLDNTVNLSCRLYSLTILKRFHFHILRLVKIGVSQKLKKLESIYLNVSFNLNSNCIHHPLLFLLEKVLHSKEKMEINQSMNVTSVNAATATNAFRATHAPHQADSEEEMVRFGQSMAQIAQNNFKNAQADRVQFSHNPNGKNSSVADAVVTSGAAVGSAAAAAGSVYAFTQVAAGQALTALGTALGALGAPALGVGLAATSALLGLYAISGFFGGSKN